MLNAPASFAGPTENKGAWFMAFGQGGFDESNESSHRFRWWLDAQLRHQGDDSGFEQFIARPGLGYAVTERATLWAGYAWIATERDTGRSDEHRLWQQLTWSERYQTVSVLLRTRLEQRFVEDGDDTGWRLRQFVKLTHPLASTPGWSIVAYDELFFDLNSTDWGSESGFSQNRLFAGVARRLGHQSSNIMEIGYLNQFIDDRTGGNTVNHLLSVNFLF